MHKHDIITHAKAQAELNNLNWSDVASTYRWLRESQRNEIAPLIELRKAIWSKFEGPAKLNYKYAFTEGDMTMIPNWDQVATAICLEFDITHDDAAQYLWDIARQDKPQMPSVADTYAQAIELCLESQASFNPDDFADTPF